MPATALTPDQISALRALLAGVDSDPEQDAVQRICRLAKTPIVSPHGLRGTHATLAVQARVTGDAVARALGHESFAVTAGHYAKPEAVIDARTDLVMNSLRNFRTSSAADGDTA